MHREWWNEWEDYLNKKNELNCYFHGRLDDDMVERATEVKV